jgi:hypothetical protein
MQSSEGFKRFTQHVLEQHDVATKLCRINFDNYITNALLPAINENNGQFKTWGVMLATSKIGIGEDDKVQSTCDRVFGFILFELFSIDVETYGAHLHLVCHEMCGGNNGLNSQANAMFDKVQQYVLEMANFLQKRYVQISLDALNQEYLIYKVYKRWGFLPVTTDEHQTTLSVSLPESDAVRRCDGCF